jgi:hypothetical protein
VANWDRWTRGPSFLQRRAYDAISGDFRADASILLPRCHDKALGSKKRPEGRF